MDPGTGFPTADLLANARRFVEATNHAFQDRNQLVAFMERSGGRTSFRFNHRFQYPRGAEASYEATTLLANQTEERDFPWDSVTALLHSLSFALVEGRGDGLFLPQIANAVSHALRNELQDQTISQGERARLEHLRAHVIRIRERFNEILAPHTVVRLGEHDPPITGREALAAWFYCMAHPTATRQERTARLGAMIRDGDFVGRRLRDNCVGILVQLTCQIRLLSHAIDSWLLNQPYELGELVDASLEEYIARARETG